MINNTYLNGIYKDAIVFFLKNIEEIFDCISKKISISQSDLLKQINEAIITIESTSYYCIMKFYHNGVYKDAHDKMIEMQLIREDGSPMVFHMYFTNSKLYEFEYFKADSSYINCEELFSGEILIDVY